MQSDPLVQAVLKRFPGAEIVGVTQNAAPPPKPATLPTPDDADLDDERED